jgi:hypothetical protein
LIEGVFFLLVSEQLDLQMDDFSEAVGGAAQWALRFEYDRLLDADNSITTGNGIRGRKGGLQFVPPFGRGKHSKSMTFIMNLYRPP